MAFDEKDIDEIRARLKVSDVVGRKFKLRKQGTEYVVADNPSFTVSDSKGIWKDFGNGRSEKAGDIFDFLQQHEGYTFVGAVEALAEQACVVIQHRPGRSPAGADRVRSRKGPDKEDGDQGRQRDAGADRTDGHGERDAAARTSHRPQSGKNEIVATWDYVDREGTLLYQTVRSQKKLTDGTWQLTKDGSKPWKTFMQRRPSPEGDGRWIFALDLTDHKTGEPAEFMLYKDAWLRFDEEKFTNWKLTERRSFPDAPALEPWLYNANDVIDELDEDHEDQRTIFIPEGEAKVDVLKEWGLLAVTSSGGAKHFTPGCAAFFAKAADVVILVDNDRAGVERAAKIAPMIKAAGAKRVRALNFRDVWPECPVKGDIKDWRDKGGGTREALLDLLDGVKDWTPEPYKSKFGAKTFRDLGGAVRAYPWRIKGIVPRDDNMLIMGPSKSGKTFEALDMLMHVHEGRNYAGKKVEPGGFVYLTYEGATGFENRLRAYLKHNNLQPEDLHSFAWLTRPPGLFAAEDNAIAVADEIMKMAETFRLPLAATVIDTHNAATRGSSEIKSEDLNKIMDNYSIVGQRTGCPLWIIGHTNAEGKHRGNEMFYNNIEASLVVERVMADDKKKIEKRDDDHRVIRRVRVSKQREGDDGLHWDFVLKSIEIGIDEDGDPITSMVSVEPARAVPDEVINEGRKNRPDGYYLNASETSIFKALLKAIDEKGVTPPASLELPKSVTRVVSTLELGKEYRRGISRNQDETPAQYTNRTKAALNRFKTNLGNVSVIAVREAGDNTGEFYIWPAGRRVFGKGLQWPAQEYRRKKQDDKPIIDEATGREITSLDDDEPPSTVF